MDKPFDIGVFVFKLPDEWNKYYDIKKWIKDCNIDSDEDFYITNKIDDVIYGEVNVYIILDMDTWPSWYCGKSPF
jgi:hypothetical protein